MCLAIACQYTACVIFGMSISMIASAITLVPLAMIAFAFPNAKVGIIIEWKMMCHAFQKDELLST